MKCTLLLVSPADRVLPKSSEVHLQMRKAMHALRDPLLDHEQLISGIIYMKKMSVE